MTYQPTDLPELRDELVRFPRTPLGQSMLEQGGNSNPAHMVAGVASTALLAELYYIAEPMVELALAAKDSLPDYDVDREDLPSEDGLCYFANPMAQYTYNETPSIVVGATWGIRAGELGVAWLIDRDYFGEHGGFGVGNTNYRSVMPRLWPIEVQLWNEPPKEGEVVPTYGRPFLKSAWRLMQQTLASTTEATFDRATRRRLQRQDITASPVRIVTLRHTTKEQHQTSAAEREYHHQWIVRGHWRQQYYPSRDVHRPLWIAPHVKGPEGKPLLGGERVHVWKR